MYLVRKTGQTKGIWTVRTGRAAKPPNDAPFVGATMTSLASAVRFPLGPIARAANSSARKYGWTHLANPPRAVSDLPHRYSRPAMGLLLKMQSARGGLPWETAAEEECRQQERRFYAKFGVPLRRLPANHGMIPVRARDDDARELVRFVYELEPTWRATITIARQLLVSPQRPVALAWAAIIAWTANRPGAALRYAELAWAPLQAESNPANPRRTGLLFRLSLVGAFSSIHLRCWAKSSADQATLSKQIQAWIARVSKRAPELAEELQLRVDEKIQPSPPLLSALVVDVTRSWRAS
jgi:hypothetical protein